MIESIFVAISLGVMLAFTIGPVFFILIETSITKGIRSALAFDFGAISGDIFFILLAYWGTSKLSDYIKNNPNLFVYGGILIIIYGLFSFFKERKDYRLHPPQTRIVEIKEGNYFTFFYKGFFLNIINVGVLLGSYHCYFLLGCRYYHNKSTGLFRYYTPDLFAHRYCKNTHR